MKNPFKAVGSVVASMYTGATQSDCAPGPAVVGTTLLMPIVIPATFIAAFFQKNPKA